MSEIQDILEKHETKHESASDRDSLTYHNSVKGSLWSRTAAIKKANKMLGENLAEQKLDINIVNIGVDNAVISMRIMDYMIMGNNTCHLGYLAFFVNSIIDYACNCGPKLMVIENLTINYKNVYDLHVGEMITGRARLDEHFGRKKIYSVTVLDDQSSLLCKCMGTTRFVKGRVE